MPDQRPNFLFMFADQMQAFAMGCVGNEEIQTPHLDALAADGVLFTNAYSNSPVCTPYRGALNSGRYPTETGCRGNGGDIPDSQQCLAHALADGGYATSWVGKWHLFTTGNIAVEPAYRLGFERFCGYQAHNSFRHDIRFFDEHGELHRPQKHRTVATTDIAIERLRELADEDRPFAHFVSYQNPHYPLEPDPGYEAMYMRAELTPRPNVDPETDPFVATWSPRSPRGPEEAPCAADPNYQRYGRSLKEFQRLYYAMITQLDAEVGRLVMELRHLGLYDSTVIVFTSDHGEMAGSHGRMNKGVPEEESSKVPFIVRDPEGLRYHRCDVPVGAAVDVYPSFLEYAGLAPEETNAGTSFVDLTRNAEANETDADRPAFAEFGDWIMVRQGPWKLVVERESLAPKKLFCLDGTEGKEADPYEQNNLVEAADGPAADAREALAGLIQSWWDRVNQ